MLNIKNPKKKNIEQTNIIEIPVIRRDTYIQRFWDEYHFCTKQIDEDYWITSVLNYYGIGGAGKTELGEQLIQELNKEKKDYLNFTFDKSYTMERSMIQIRNVLVEKYKADFSLFDMVYLSYCKKQGHKLTEFEEKSLLSSKYMEALYPILGTIPLFAINLAVAIPQGLKPFEKRIREALKDKSYDFWELSSVQLGARLPEYFSRSMYNFLNNRKEPFVVYLDNMDAIPNDEIERWFLGEKGLFYEMTSVVWIIMSRDEFKEYDSERMRIQPIRVDCLEQEEVNEFLERAGVKKEFHSDIHLLTQGFPLYLNICVQSYYNCLRNKKKFSVSDLGVTKEKMIKKYYDYLEPKQQKMLLIMTFLERWNDELFFAMLEPMNTIDKMICIDSYKILCKMSIIHREKEFYYLHSVVCDTLMPLIGKVEYDNLHNKLLKLKDIDASFALDYWLIKLKLHSANQNGTLEEALWEVTRMFYDDKRADNYEASKNLLRTITNEMLKLNQKSAIQLIGYVICSHLAQNNENEKRAYEYAQKAAEIAVEEQRPKIMDEKRYYCLVIDAKEQYAHMCMITGNLEKSREIREKIYKDSKGKFGSKSYETIVAEQNLCSVDLLDPIKIPQAIEWQKHILHKRNRLTIKNEQQRKQNEQHIIFAKSNIGKAYMLINDYENAIRWMQDAAKEAFELYGIEEHWTQVILHEYMTVLTNLEAYSEVVDTLEKIYSIWKGKLVNQSELLQSVRYNLAVAYSETNNIEKAKELFEENFKISHDLKGPYHKETLRYQKEYAICLTKEGKHEEALELLEDVFKNYILIYEDDDSEQLNNLKNLIYIEKRTLENK